MPNKPEENQLSKEEIDDFFAQEDIEIILDEELRNAQETIRTGKLEEENIQKAREHYNKKGEGTNTGPTYKPEIEELEDRS